jgi:ubiquinone/menaquinone biosynthesis C-methylase UbiE
MRTPKGVWSYLHQSIKSFLRQAQIKNYVQAVEQMKNKQKAVTGGLLGFDHRPPFDKSPQA